MTTATRIQLQIDSPERRDLVAEQLGHLSSVVLVDSKPDALITDADISTSDNTIFHLVLDKGPLRLGQLLDQLRYGLSGRQDHLESDDEINLGIFLFLPNENRLQHITSGDIIHLTDKERLLLRVLYEAENNTLDRGTLLAKVWQYADDAETHTFETHLYRLRQKLNPYEGADLIRADGEGNYSLMLNA